VSTVIVDGPVPAHPVVIVGATATGKSDLAVELALRWSGEVVNADSMQLYRGMDIGTAKLTTAERRGVPHHLLDVWDVRRPASVADYQLLADDVLADRPVALKLINPDLADEDPFRQRFLREATAAAAIDHPHILPVYDAGEEADVTR